MKADFYVATNGNDSWSGRLAAPNADGTDGPFASIARAQKALREAKKYEPGRPYMVSIRSGVYRLNDTLLFTPDDSGSKEAPTIYAAYPGESPVLSGGRLITGWQKASGEIWTAQIPEVKAGKWYFHQLFVNGQRRTRARTPNEGYLLTDGPIEPLGDRQKARGDKSKKLGFRYKPGDIRKWEDLEDVNIIAFHAWTASVHYIESLDEENRIVRFATPSGWPMAWWEKNQRYYIENYREALDSPGEWYLDRKTGLLSYWPMPGEDMTQAEVVAPVLRHLVRFAGDATLGLPVEYITLRGLSFQHADWLFDRNTVADGQAGVGFLKGAIHANGAHHCSIENCEIAHVGEYALWLGSECKDNRVFHCHLHDLGAGGVVIGETTSPASDATAAERNVVDNNFIHDGGHVIRQGIGVIILRSSHNTVTHNEVCDFDYSGMSVGWCWGYASSSAHHNVVEYNHIHHIGRGVLSDMGGIYTLGVSPGTRLCYNVIHDVYSYSYGGWGLYTDEGSSEILLENNVVYNTKTGGFHQHYGRENIVRNNIFAFSQEGQIIRSRQEDHISFFFERNIVYFDNGQLLGGNWSNGNYRMDNNLYWDTSDPEIEFAGMSFEEWKAKGFDQHSLIADPLFVDAKNGNFRLRPGSPAEQIGFQPIDVSKVGLYGEPEWVEAPKKIVRPPISLPPPEPQTLDDGFEQTPVGEPPARAHVSGEDNGASVRVTDETAASGKHSLKFVDAPDLTHEWQPHIFYRLRLDKGKVRASLDVRMEKGAILWMEWRDSGSPYKVGPSIRIEKTGEVRAGRQTLLTVPLGQWVHFEITCGLGKSAAGVYDLTVTAPNQPPKKFENLPFGSPDWKRLHWLGFMSMAKERAVWYLDNLRMECEK